MHIDVCFDLICPWCYIGKKRLQQALGLRPKLQVEINWIPFMLNPTMPPAGMDHWSYLLAKFGTESRVRRLLGALETTGQSEEINFNFDGILQTPNTSNAHRLVIFSAESGCAEPTVEALFRAYFIEGRNIGELDELCVIGRSVGLDGPALEHYLSSSIDVISVNGQNTKSQRMGINGVPCYLINGELALQGAHLPEVIARLLDVAAA